MDSNLPKGWIETTLGEIAEWASGGTPKATEAKYYGGDIPWLIIGDLNDGEVYKSTKTITKLGLENSSAKIVPINSVLIAMYGSIGKLGIVKIECATNQAIAFTQKIYGNIPYKFLYYYLFSIREDLLKQGKGGAQQNISQTVLKEVSFPLPPLPEQQRIVEKLDLLMARINNSKVRLEKIPALIKNFRQSVLAAAVSGELTKEWREENKHNSTLYKAENRNDDYKWKEYEFPNNWKWDYTKNLGHHILGKMLDAAKNKGELTPYLRNINVRWFEFNLEDLSQMKCSDDERIKFNIKNGDVFICEGGEPGRCAVWEGGESKLIFQKALHRIRFINDVEPKWFVYNLKTDCDNGSIETLFTGTGIKHLTGKSLSKYPIPIPPLEEQKEIVRKVEELFHFADSIEARYQKAKVWFDKLPQSILAKAFRGELVPQNENDEPAEVLLSRIKNQKAKTEEKKKEREKNTNRLTKGKNEASKIFNLMNLVDIIKNSFHEKLFTFEELEKVLSHKSKMEYVETKKQFFALLRNDKFKKKEIKLTSELDDSGIIKYKLTQV